MSAQPTLPVFKPTTKLKQGLLEVRKIGDTLQQTILDTRRNAKRLTWVFGGGGIDRDVVEEYSKESTRLRSVMTVVKSDIAELQTYTDEGSTTVKEDEAVTAGLLEDVGGMSQQDIAAMGGMISDAQMIMMMRLVINRTGNANFMFDQETQQTLAKDEAELAANVACSQPLVATTGGDAAQLREELDTAHSELESYRKETERELFKLRTRVHGLHDARDAAAKRAEDDRISAAKRIEAQEAVVSDLEAKVAFKYGRIVELQEALEARPEDGGDSDERIRQLEADLQDHKRTADILNKEIQDLNGRLSQDRAPELEQQLESMETTLQLGAGEIEALCERVKTLECKIAELESVRQEQCKLVDRLERDRDEARKQHAAEEKAKKYLETEREELRCELDKHKKTTSFLALKLAKATNKEKQTLGELKQKMLDLEYAESRLATLAEELSGVEAQDKLSAELARASERIEALGHKLGEKEEAWDAERSRVAELDQQMATMQLQAGQSRAAWDQAKLGLEEVVQGKERELSVAHDELKASRADWESEKARLETDNSGLADEVNVAKARVSLLEENLAAGSEERKGLVERVKTLGQEVSDARSELKEERSRASADRTRLDEQVRELELAAKSAESQQARDVDSWQQEQSVLEGEIEDLQGRLADVTARAEERDSASSKELEAKTSEIGVLELRVANLEEKVDRVTEEAKERDAACDRQLQSKDADIQSKAAEIQSLQTQVTDLRDQFAETSRKAADDDTTWSQKFHSKEAEMQKRVKELHCEIVVLNEGRKEDDRTWTVKLQQKTAEADALGSRACEALSAAVTLHQSVWRLDSWTDWLGVIRDVGGAESVLASCGPEPHVWSFEAWPALGGTSSSPLWLGHLSEMVPTPRSLALVLRVALGTSPWSVLPLVNLLARSLASAAEAPSELLVRLLGDVAETLSGVESEEKAVLLGAIHALRLLLHRFGAEAAREVQRVLAEKLDACSSLLTDFVPVIGGSDPQRWEVFAAARRLEGRVYGETSVVLNSKTHAVLIDAQRLAAIVLPSTRMEKWRLSEIRFNGCDEVLTVRGTKDNLTWWVKLPRD